LIFHEAMRMNAGVYLSVPLISFSTKCVRPLRAH
jgi:hypothetical protein